MFVQCMFHTHEKAHEMEQAPVSVWSYGEGYYSKINRTKNNCPLIGSIVYSDGVYARVLEMENSGMIQYMMQIKEGHKT